MGSPKTNNALLMSSLLNYCLGTIVLLTTTMLLLTFSLCGPRAKLQARAGIHDDGISSSHLNHLCRSAVGGCDR
eukprot:scaffold160107_cov53-Attheya_sp.AAC.1